MQVIELAYQCIKAQKLAGFNAYMCIHVLRLYVMLLHGIVEDLGSSILEKA